jgi:hypothetical protein
MQPWSTSGFVYIFFDAKTVGKAPTASFFIYKEWFVQMVVDTNLDGVHKVSNH